MKFWEWPCAAGVSPSAVILLIGKDDMIRCRRMHRM